MRQKFSESYPYLAYYIEAWGTMETTDGEWNNSRLTLLDEGGIVYEDKGSDSHDEALDKAEAFLRNEYASEYFDQASIDDLEEDYEEFGLDKES